MTASHFGARTYAGAGTSAGVAPVDRRALGASIASRFDEVAAAVPDRIAISAPGGEVSYARLQQLSDRFAGAVVARIGAGHDDAAIPVVTLLGQGIRAIAAQLGLLKAGCAYVPLDPRHPAAANASLVEHVRPALVVVDASTADTGSRVAGSVPIVEFEALAAGAPRPFARPAIDANAIAYIYCTSGSTGRPKAVADTHRNVLHNVLRYTRTLGITHDDRLTLLQSPAFSGAVSSTWGALLNGATLCPYDVLADGPDALGDWVANCAITIYHSVPSLFRRLVAGRRAFPQMRVIRLEGDRALASDAELYKAHFPRTCTLVNGLGTTETGLVRQFFVDHDTAVAPGLLPIGYAVDDMEVMVVAADGSPVARGEVGEIAVRSRYLALGYWRDEALTRAKFVPAPSDPQARVYRTGDLGRMRDDGCLEHLGRSDTLVKVRGQSVDLSLVEQLLTAHPGVRDAAALPRLREDGETEIVAFVAPASGAALTTAELGAALRRTMPPIMIPAAIAMRGSLPLMPHGKLDRRALAALASQAGDDAVRARHRGGDPAAEADQSSFPHGAVEVQVARIWQEVLGQSSIGVDQAFADIGGDSLHAAQVMARVRQLFARDLPLDSLWLHGRTIRTLSRLLLRDDADPVWRGPVAFKASGDDAPLFGLPVAGGHLHFYDALSRHTDRRRPVYGLPPRGVDGRDPAHASLACMASHALEQMRTVQPSGPYHLVGFCSGGVLAFELARQLRSRGERIGLLALVDCATPGRWAGMREELGALDERWRLLQERLYAIALGLVRMPHLRQLRGAAESHRWALWNYRPRVLDERVLLVNPSDDAAVRRSERRWRSLAGKGIEIVHFPGGHGDLLREPGVVRLAQCLDAHLSEERQRSLDDGGCGDDGAAGRISPQAGRARETRSAPLPRRPPGG